MLNAHKTKLMQSESSQAPLALKALEIQQEHGRDAAIKFLLEHNMSAQMIAFFLPISKTPVTSPDVYKWITEVTVAYLATLTAAWQPIGAHGWHHRRVMAEGARQLWTTAVGNRARARDRQRLDALIDGMPME